MKQYRIRELIKYNLHTFMSRSCIQNMYIKKIKSYIRYYHISKYGDNAVNIHFHLIVFLTYV